MCLHPCLHEHPCACVFVGVGGDCLACVHMITFLRLPLCVCVYMCACVHVHKCTCAFTACVCVSVCVCVW